MVDSTGTDFYLVATSVATTTKAECTTAISTAKRIKNLKTFGDIGGTRAVTEEKFLSSDDSVKSMGSISYGNMPVECLFDPADTEGQSILKTMYEDKSERKMIIENTDGTFTILLVKNSSSMKTYNIDTFVLYKGTLEQNSAVTEVIA
jgi:hypothetical protein